MVDKKYSNGFLGIIITVTLHMNTVGKNEAVLKESVAITSGLVEAMGVFCSVMNDVKQFHHANIQGR